MSHDSLNRAFALVRNYGAVVSMEDDNGNFWEINWLIEEDGPLPSNMGWPRVFWATLNVAGHVVHIRF